MKQQQQKIESHSAIESRQGRRHELAVSHEGSPLLVPQVQHVLSSSTLSRLRESRVLLELRTRKAGADTVTPQAHTPPPAAAQARLPPNPTTPS